MPDDLLYESIGSGAEGAEVRDGALPADIARDSELAAHAANANAHHVPPAATSLLPILPSANQTTQFLRGDRTWAVPAGGGADIPAQTTAPTSPSEGDLWYDTGTDELKAYDGSAWEVIGPSSLSVTGAAWTISANAPGTYTLYAVGEDLLYTVNASTGRATAAHSTANRILGRAACLAAHGSSVYVISRERYVTGYRLYRVNTSTGATTLVGATGVNAAFTGMASHNNTLYAITSTNLYTLNTATGASTLVGPLGVTRANSLASHLGTLYAQDSSATITGNLLTVDPSSGAAAVVGPTTGLRQLYGLASVGSTLYGAGVSGNQYRLYTVNTGTGAVTLVGSFGLAPTGQVRSEITGLTSVASGVTDGQGWYDTASDVLFVFDGSNWTVIGPRDVGGGGGGSGLDTAAVNALISIHAGQAGAHHAAPTTTQLLPPQPASNRTTQYLRADRTWSTPAGSGGSGWTVAALAPTSPSPVDGDGWYDTSTDELKIYDGTQWETIGAAGSATGPAITSAQADAKITAHADISDAHHAAPTATQLLPPQPSSNQTTQYLRADRTWSTPPLRTQAQTITLIGLATTQKQGLVPARPSTNQTTQFLRADNTWAVPAGGSGGLNTSQVNTLITNSINSHALQPNIHHTPPTAGGDAGWAVQATQPGGVATLYVLDDTTDDLYSVNPSTGTTTVLSRASGTNFGGMSSFAGTLYAVESSDDSLYRVNFPTGGIFATRIGTSGALGTGSWHSLAGLGGSLYAIEANTRSLYTVNTLNGTTTLVGTSGALGTGSYFSLAGHNGNLYTIDDNSNNLYTVSTTTGAKTLVGSVGSGIWTGLTSHNGTLYAITRSTLYTVNTTNGSVTSVGSMGLASAFALASHSTGGAAPSLGDGWYDTSVNQLKIYNGSAWVAV